MGEEDSRREKPTLKKKNQEGRRETEREEERRNRETERRGEHQGKERRGERVSTTTEAKTNANKGIKAKNDNSAWASYPPPQQSQQRSQTRYTADRD